MTTIRKDAYVPPHVLARYHPAVQALVKQGLVELPAPPKSKFEIIVERKRRAKIPLLKGDGTRWDQIPEIQAAVKELLAMKPTEIVRGTVARIAYQHRAPYQAVRCTFREELERRKKDHGTEVVEI